MVSRPARSLRFPVAASLLLAASAVFSLPASAQPPSASQKRADAHSQFVRAEKLRTALGGKPQAERTLGEYRQLVREYRKVYLITPHAVIVPQALLTVAELYHDMGRQFDPKYHRDAIDAYQFLLKHYPTSRYCDDALFTIGQVQQSDLEQRDAAEATYREFLQRYPRSPKGDQARAALELIAKEREQAEKSSSSRKELAEKKEKDRRLPQVTGLRNWNAENSTRIVIDVEHEVKWQAARIDNPDRIYFDIYKAKLASTLAGKTQEVAGGFLKAIRVAQNQAGVVRVVLEVDKVKNYSVFLLPNPYRLVVDVHGEPVTLAKAAPATEVSEPVRTEQKTAGPSASAAKEEKSATVAPRVENARAEKSGPAKPERSETARAEPPAPSKGSRKKEPPESLTPSPAAQPNRNGQISLTRAMGLKIGRVVIDAGHGGHDTGTIGPSGLMEKDLCLDVALRLGKMIRDKLPGVEVVFTREDDTFVPLEQRTALANQSKADVFLSIHANSSRSRDARGVETFYLSFTGSEDALEVAARENALSQSSISELQDMVKKIANNEKVEESRELAADMQEALAKRMQRVTRAVKDRGVKRAPFVVLIGANMPSVLSEISFLSNPNDEKLLKGNSHRNRVAEGLFNGLQSYLQNLGSLSYNRPAQPSPAAARD